MLALIAGNIGYILTGLLVVAAIYSYFSKNNDIWVGCIVLCAIALPAWFNSWQSPETMGIVHFTILFWTLILSNCAFLRRISVSLLVMIAADALGHIALIRGEGSLFWWQSALNVIFAYQCLDTIFTARKLIRSKKKAKGVGHDQFLAKTAHTSH